MGKGDQRDEGRAERAAIPGGPGFVAAAKLSGTVGAAAALPVTGALSLARRAPRRTRRGVAGAASGAATATVDAVLESRTADQILGKVIGSPLVERTLSRAL